MKFRTSYLVGLMASVLAVSSTTYFIYPAVAADAPKIKPLKIMGPDGQIRQVNHQYGPTTAKDTFWSIAQKVRPDASVSVYQVMAALFDANPHAFYSDSYNSLERGMILLVPSKEVMQAIPNSVAIARAKRVDKQVRTVAKTATNKPSQTEPSQAKPRVVSPVVKPPVVKPPVVKADAVNPSASKPVSQVNSNELNTLLDNTSAKAAGNTQTATNTQVSNAAQTAQPNTQAPTASASTATAATAGAATVAGAAIAASSSAAVQSSGPAADANLDVNQRLEAAQSKTLALTDELARTQDQLTLRNADVKALQAKLDELTQQNAVLDETLMASKQQNQALTAELAAAQSTQTAPSQLDTTTADADDLWDQLINNPLLLVAAAVVPALVILFLVYFLLRRKRNKEREQLAAQHAAMALGGAAVAGSVIAHDDDTLGAMAVQLADEHPDSMDSLLDIRSVDLQPEQEIDDSHEHMDMASEMFIDRGSSISPAIDEDEGQSLDDLWAEAMGEQTEEISAPNSAVDEAVDELARFSADMSANEVSSKLENEDFDALLAGLTTPVVANTDEARDVEANVVSQSESVSASQAVATLSQRVPFAEDDAPDTKALDDDLAAEIAAELAGELDSLGVVARDDDIDALLAAFDKPATDVANPTAPDTALAEEIAAELGSELADIGLQDTDDIDALLASFNAPLQHAEHHFTADDAHALASSNALADETLGDEVDAELISALPEELDHSD
ncbi:MAG: FimV/HubP family polar landmark protein, partial [Shewanella sp.]